jgi:CheY-specific phosphatase CheX
MGHLNNQDIITTQLENIFSTMLSLPVNSSSAETTEAPGARIAGTVGIGGDKFAGSMHIVFPSEFADQVACAMLGGPASSADLTDVIGEIANMVAAGLKNAYCNAGIKCAITVPTVIKGVGFTIANMQNVQRELFAYRSGMSTFFVELQTRQMK